ncbi:50S ribosomal protein L25 [Clostridium sp. PL3]|uniref:Large ribosomal subunit protein bL25 n=1 Tax=Clostridium thailandense TaxID=2794346 RepID=A0A949TTZ8_9CLOT|nr:50S ribosomal protein L25 [Clostridium thailandense]MBV7271330.1 50S ribosomal protein L25 [Clostridium thailandense]
MEPIVLNAVKRTVKSKKIRKEGFIPGVVYGDNVAEADSVTFEETTLKKILDKHGSNVKLWIKCENNKKFGFIKEIQRHPVSNKIIHLDVQLVSKDHEVKLQIPIIFKGEVALGKRQLRLQMHKSEVDVLSKISLVPEVLNVDVSQKNLGDIITSEDFDLDKQIKIHEKENEVYATITKLATKEIKEPAEEEAKE